MHYSKKNLKTQQGRVMILSHLKLPLSEQGVCDTVCGLAIYMKKVS
jgi:hypothetical protein